MEAMKRIHSNRASIRNVLMDSLLVETSAVSMILNVAMVRLSLTDEKRQRIDLYSFRLGYDDCYDGNATDEIGCPSRVCNGTDTMKCPNNNICIRRSYLCGL